MGIITLELAAEWVKITRARSDGIPSYFLISEPLRSTAKVQAAANDQTINLATITLSSGSGPG